MIYGTLHLRLSSGQQQSHNISQSSILIGRGLANDLLINDPTVAPAHARLTFQKGEVVIEDLGTINGTFINGVRLEPKKPYVLSRAEMMRFGSVDAVLAPANIPAPEWPPMTAPEPAPAPTTAPVTAPSEPEPVTEVLPPPAAKLVSLKVEPKRSTRDFTISVTRVAEDPDTSLQTILLAGTDPTEDLAFTFKPQILKLEPGQTKTSLLQVRGLPSTFTITAAGKGKSYTAATKAALVAPDRSMQIVGVVAIILACITGVFALAACPTALRAVCGFIPANALSMAVSTPTFTPSATPTATSEATLVPTNTLEPTSTLVTSQADTQVAVATEATQPPVSSSGGVLTFKRQQANGSFTLLAVTYGASEPVTLIANKAGYRILDYSPENNLFAVDVDEGFAHTLWLVKGDGTTVVESVNEGWASIRNGDFSPDGSYFVLDTLGTDNRARYLFYSPDGQIIRDLSPITPTATYTPSRTPTFTATSTFTPTNTRTPSETPTPRPTRTSSPTEPPTSTRTPSATQSPTITRTPTSTP